MISALLLGSVGIGCGDDDGDGGGETDAGGVDAGGTGGSGGSSGAGSGGSGGAGSGGSSGAGSGGSGGVGPEDDGGADDDAGGGEPDAGATSLRDLTIELTDFGPHLDQLMQFRVVSDDDELLAFGVLDPIEDADTTFVFPSSLPEGEARLDFWADLNGNRAYNPPPADHAWRLPIAASGDVTIDYPHDTDFTNIAMPAYAEGGDFSFEATGWGPHVGQRFELRVIDEDTGRLVGRYVLGEIDAGDFEVTLAGVVESGRSYQVDFTADLDGDGEYDAPPTDHAWRVSETATASGLTVEYPHDTDFTDVQF